MAGRMEQFTAGQAIKEMNIGWNLGNTFDAVDMNLSFDSSPKDSETAWHNPVTTEENIDTVIKAGFNAIRIPVSWGTHMDFAHDYKVNEAWMNRVREVADYAYKRGAYVIINTHHDAYWLNTFEKDYEKGSKAFAALWNQIADAFADYDEHIIFEGMNELRYPHTDIEWIGDDAGYEIVNRYNELFVRTIRDRQDNNKDRILVISTYCGAQRENVLRNYAVPLNNGEKDEKLIIAVHSYDPEPFALTREGTGIWTEADKGPIDAVFERINNLLKPFDVPVIIDEFAALKRSNPENDECRVKWTSYFVGKAKENGIICFWWDNGNLFPDWGSMGIFDRYKNTWRWPELVEVLTGNKK